jgi:hypothetical protein
VCSSSFGQPQWVLVGQNTTACPAPILVPLTSTNNTLLTGYTASYYNTTTGVTYNFTISNLSGLRTLGSMPAGTYNLTITQTGYNNYVIISSGCRFQTLSGITPLVFYNIAVSATNCKSITLNYAGS